MEGVKSSPNNPGRQAILLSSLTLQPPLSHPLLHISYISVTPIVSLLSLSVSFLTAQLALAAFLPIDVKSRRHLTFIVSDNLLTEKASGTLRRIRDHLSLSFWEVRG